MSQSEDLQTVVVTEKKREFDEKKTLLDALRSSRKSRGLGAPLDLPRHLQNAIVFTDADLPRPRPIVMADEDPKV